MDGLVLKTPFFGNLAARPQANFAYFANFAREPRKSTNRPKSLCFQTLSRPSRANFAYFANFVQSHRLKGRNNPGKPKAGILSKTARFLCAKTPPSATKRWDGGTVSPSSTHKLKAHLSRRFHELVAFPYY